MAEWHLDYLDELISLLERIKTEEKEALAEAANMVADAIEAGHRIFGFGCTHSSLPVQDIVYRAGGLILVNPIFGPGVASLDARPATMTSDLERLPGLAEVILDNQPIERGDLLILVSVSGRNPLPIEMAMEAKERGLKIIGLTSMAYTESVESRHDSGRRMYEIADVVLDNKVPAGDAVLSAEGVPQRFAPASGVTSTALLHALMAATIEELVARGITPPVTLAANVDGGDEHNARVFAEYGDRIFYL